MTRTLGVGLLICACAGWASPAQANVATDWNAITLRCVQGAPPTIPANRGGPVGLLDVALVQAAVHDAVQAIEGRFEQYQYKKSGNGSVNAAVAAAAYGVLVGLYGIDDPCLDGIEDPAATYAGDAGVQSGAAAAAALLPLYRQTFQSPLDPFLGGTGPGEWRPTPGFTEGANTFMAFTAPFVLERTSQFRPQRQPPMESHVYAQEYEEVRKLGSLTGSTRSPEQTDLARFWMANPISTWYGALRGIIDNAGLNVGDSARLLALASLAAADGQMTIYETKYWYNFWRPITAIHFGDTDGNPTTEGQPGWEPLVQTPPYPDYSSGANCLAASILTTVQLFFGSDELEFSVLSSIGGLTKNPRVYTRLSDAMQDIVEVRILQGIHFRSADEEGRRQGARVAHWTVQKFLRPVPGS